MMESTETLVLATIAVCFIVGFIVGGIQAYLNRDPHTSRIEMFILHSILGTIGAGTLAFFALCADALFTVIGGMW
jgi:hypothetical protein